MPAHEGGNVPPCHLDNPASLVVHALHTPNPFSL